MPNAIRWDLDSVNNFALTLGGLASSTSGVGRQSALIDNDTNWWPAAKVYVQIRVGTTPTANTAIDVYLIQSSDDVTSPVRSDNAGTGDASITILNSRLLGTLFVNATTSDVNYYGVFDTWAHGPLGAQWGIAVVHNTAVNLFSAETGHLKQYRYYNPEVQ